MKKKKKALERGLGTAVPFALGTVKKICIVTMLDVSGNGRRIFGGGDNSKIKGGNILKIIL